MQDITNNLAELFPENRKVIFLHAHPDDESFLNAGLIRRLADIGRDCRIVFCAGRLIENSLSQQRQTEAYASAKLLGCSDIHFLNYDNIKGTRPFAHAELSEAMTEIDESLGLSFVRDSIVVSYDENGGYGNADHIMLHKLGREIGQSCLLLESTINRESMNLWISNARQRLAEVLLPKLSYWVENFGSCEQQITHFFNLNDNLQAVKRKSLSCHKTQMSDLEFPLGLDMEDFKAVLGTEFLIQVSAGEANIRCNNAEGNSCSWL